MTEENDDPLQLKNLAVHFDYLMYKIKDRITSLSELTHQSVVSKKDLIENDYFGNQLQLDKQLAEADALLKECAELELLFMKVDQLTAFVRDFRTRVAVLEEEFSAL